jgi:DNA-binding CsgD family transcriptional regulator/tetratricopeptide (TPR) repeat protein
VGLLRCLLDELAPNHPQRDDILARLVTAELFTGRLRVAESLAREALGARPLGAEARHAITYGLAQSLLLQGRLAEAAVMLGAAGDAEPSPDPSVLADSAMTLMFDGQLEAAMTEAERALLGARARGDVVAEVAALGVMCSVLGLRGELAVALECGRAAASRADHGGDPDAHRNMPDLFLASALLWADQVEETADALARADEIGRRLGLGWHDPIRLATLADLQYRLGDWGAAVASAESGLARSLDRGAGMADVWSHAVLARIHLHRGELEAATEATDRAEHATKAGGTGTERIVAARALCAEASGDLERALAIITSLFAVLRDHGIAVKLFELSADAARIARRSGDHAFASTVLEVGGQLARRCPDSAAPAMLTRCRGIVEGDPALLARAAAMLRLRRRPLEQAFTVWEAGTLLAARGDDDGADRLFAAAGETLGPIGARPLPLDPPRGLERAAGGSGLGWSTLTPAERTVVELVAAGLSNAEIAGRLICSRRTVESHLHHVYTKLGTSSRVALAIDARHHLGPERFDRQGFPVEEAGPGPSRRMGDVLQLGHRRAVADLHRLAQLPKPPEADR